MSSNNDNHVIEDEDAVGDVRTVTLFSIVRLVCIIIVFIHYRSSPLNLPSIG